MACDCKFVSLFSVFICDLPFDGICLQFMLSEVKHSENIFEDVIDIDQKTYSKVSGWGRERKVVFPFKDT